MTGYIKKAFTQMFGADSDLDDIKRGKYILFFFKRESINKVSSKDHKMF